MFYHYAFPPLRLGDGERIGEMKGDRVPAYLDENGTPVLDIYPDGNKETYEVATVVAVLTYDNPDREKYTYLHFIDGNEMNTSPNNVIWCTEEEDGTLTREEASGRQKAWARKRKNESPKEVVPGE